MYSIKNERVNTLLNTRNISARSRLGCVFQLSNSSWLCFVPSGVFVCKLASIMRSAKIHARQYELLVDAVEMHQSIQTGGGDPHEVTRLWQHLAEQLNSVGVGPLKSWIDWRKALQHWKSVTRAKARALMHGEPVPAGGGPATWKRLTPVEERLLAAFEEDCSVVSAEQTAESSLSTPEHFSSGLPPVRGISSASWTASSFGRKRRLASDVSAVEPVVQIDGDQSKQARPMDGVAKQLGAVAEGMLGIAGGIREIAEGMTEFAAGMQAIAGGMQELAASNMASNDSLREMLNGVVRLLAHKKNCDGKA